MKAPRMQSHRAAGFSLVELMLALMLGLLVVTGIVQLFVGNSQTYNILHGQARLQESGRFALDFISRAARSAGYFGCSYEAANLVPGLRGAAGNNWGNLPEFNVTVPVQGYEGSGGNWDPPLNTLPTSVNSLVPANAIDTGTVEPGTDVLVLRSMQRPGLRLAQVLQPDGDPIVSAPGGNLPVDVDDIVMVGDCEQAAVFRVTGVAPLGADEFRLFHGTGPGLYDNSNAIDLPTGGTSAGFILSFLGRSYGEDATLGRVETTVFYIAEGEGLDNQGAAPLSLWQKVGSQAPVELLQGVEDLEVLYGFDTTLTDGISNANQYVNFNDLPDPNDPSDVVALRVSVTVNSVDAVADGNVLRRTFTKTLLLRNANPEV